MTREKAILILDSLSTWLGYERPITEEIVEAIKTLSQPSLSSNIDDVAVQAHIRMEESGEDMTFLNTFKAGAEWIAEQGVTKEGVVFDNNEFIKFTDGTFIDLMPDQNVKSFDFQNDDKVIVQIRKK